MTPGRGQPSVELVGLPYCTTCQKVQGALEKAGVKVLKFRDVKSEPLSEAEVRELARRVGGVPRLFSRRAMKYRALGLDKKELSEEEMVRWMANEYTFVTRPVVLAVGSDRAFCGGAPKALSEFLREL